MSVGDYMNERILSTWAYRSRAIRAARRSFPPALTTRTGALEASGPPSPEDAFADSIELECALEIDPPGRASAPHSGPVQRMAAVLQDDPIPSRAQRPAKRGRQMTLLHPGKCSAAKRAALAAIPWPSTKPGREDLLKSVSNRILACPLLHTGDLTDFAKPVVEAPNETHGPFPPGVLLLRGFLTHEEQIMLVKCAQALHEEAPLFIPSFRLYGRECFYNAFLTSTGRHWDGTARCYTDNRADFDGSPVPKNPVCLVDLFQRVFRDPRVIASGLPAPETFDDLITLLNYYPPGWGTKAAHKDDSESLPTLRRGVPVVSVNVGDSADFFVQVPRAARELATSPDSLADTGMMAAATKDTERVVVRLESGDVLLFGGPARLAHHGVSKIHQGDRPKGLPLIPGRLNFTIRAV
jgi:DNA oxidative demethylase